MLTDSIDIRQLRYFIAVAEARSFTRAAQVLNVAQPALSNQVRRLEEALNCQLLRRTGRGAELTADGQLVLARAQDVLAAMARLRDGLRPEETAGAITLGLPMTVSPILSHVLMSRIGERAPRISLRLTEGMSVFLAEWLAEGRLDAAILFGNQHHPRIIARPITVEPLCLVGPRDAFPPGTEVPVARLADYPLILPSRQNALHQIILQAALVQGVDLTIRYELDVVGEILHGVLRRDGFAILAPIAFAAALERDDISFARLVDPEVQRVWAWAERAGAAGGAALARVRDMAVELLQQRTRESMALAGLAKP